MRRVEVDVAVIGAGTAGLGAYDAAKAAGARAVLIEAGAWGTTCVRVGCMPSKLLLAAARMAREAGRTADFGVEAGPVRVDGAAVMARLRRERDHFLRGILDKVAAMPDDDKVEGRARFTGPTTLAVGAELEVRAQAVVVATGARPAVPEALKQLGDRVLTNETVFELEALPASLAVIGAGPLGLELGVAFTRLGVRTTVFDEGEAVGGLKDPEVDRVARALFEEELDLKLGVKIEAEPVAEGARLRWRGEGGQEEAVFERVLVAAGRPPDFEGLDLPVSGLTLDEHGAPDVDRGTLRCGESAVFVAGDATHELPVLHEASRQGALAGRNAAHLSSVERETPPAALSIVFSDPDIAAVGRPLSKLGKGAVAGGCDFGAGRGGMEGRRGGRIRLYARRGDRLIAGAEMVGPAVEHLAHLVAVMVQERLTVDRALALPFYHPTYEEDLQNALRDLRDRLDAA